MSGSGPKRRAARSWLRERGARLMVTMALVVVCSGCTGLDALGWGFNGAGRIGDGTTTNRRTPTAVGDITDWVAIDAGGRHTCAIRAGGTLWCWGDNQFGELGDGSTTSHPSPAQVGTDETWKSVSTGTIHTCATKTDGTLWCFGWNLYGQLGDGTQTNRLVPTRIGSAADWLRVSAGGHHTCATRSPGRLWCWGENGSGRLGDGTTTTRLVPKRIGTASDWIRSTAGATHSCGLRATGVLWCWGSNANGRLGDGTTTTRTSPVEIGFANWVDIAAAEVHTCGLQTGGTLWCWGGNADGQLGVDDTIARSAPTHVAPGSTWNDVDTGGYQSCGIPNDAAMWCWGDNTYGQLGDNTVLDASYPVRSGVERGWGRVSVGGLHVMGLRSPVDRDGDRLADSVETDTGEYQSPDDTGTDPSNPDSDNDGLLDGDEVLGSSAGLNLPAMGVNPLKQNILLEIDWFNDSNEPAKCAAHSHRPSAAVITQLTNAFATAPTTNPDGSTGIQLIADYGQGGQFTGGNLISDADGVIAGHIDDSDYGNYKAANHKVNRRGYFHYVLMPHFYDTNSRSGGEAEYFGDDMIVSMGCAPPATYPVANTLMHELGHNLALDHGGLDEINFKPNYNSVMNYRYQYPGIDSNCNVTPNGVLSFSPGTRITLNENALTESRGVCGSGYPLDWNKNSIIDAGSVKADINDDDGVKDGIFEVLRDYNDWANLYLNGIDPYYGSSGAPVGPVRIISEPSLPGR